MQNKRTKKIQAVLTPNEKAILSIRNKIRHQLEILPPDRSYVNPVNWDGPVIYNEREDVLIKLLETNKIILRGNIPQPVDYLHNAIINLELGKMKEGTTQTKHYSMAIRCFEKVDEQGNIKSEQLPFLERKLGEAYFRLGMTLTEWESFFGKAYYSTDISDHISNVFQKAYDYLDSGMRKLENQHIFSGKKYHFMHETAKERMPDTLGNLLNKE